MKGDFFESVHKYYGQYRKIKQDGLWGGVFKYFWNHSFLRTNRYVRMIKTAKRKTIRTKSKKTGGIKTKRRYTQELSTSVPKHHWDRAIWPTIRQYRLHLDNYTCQKCGKKKKPFFLRCHHRSYDRVDTEYEILDCITVCDKCHEEIHFG